MDDDQQFCLRWNNHQSTLISVFDTLLENETLVDCTLAAEGKFLKAHKVVLSACSPYFATLLQEQYDKHPIFILKDVKYQELRAMMDYMYRGEVNISQDQLAALLKAAESLQIKGLSDNRTSAGNSGNTIPKIDTSSHQAQQQQQQHRNLNVPLVGKISGGYTLEQTKRQRLGPSTLDAATELSGSREGSSSPSRRRRKVRRRSIENTVMSDVHHDNSNSSQQQTNSIVGAPTSGLSGVSAITAAASALAAAQLPAGALAAAAAVAAAAAATGSSSSNVVAGSNLTANVSATSANVTKKTEGNIKSVSGVTTAPNTSSNNNNNDAMTTENLTAAGGSTIMSTDDQEHQHHLNKADKQPQQPQQHHNNNNKQQHKIGAKDTSDLVVEPKSEYDDEGNEETVEDLTLDDEDMGMDDLDHNAGTSQGGAEGSNQGYVPWQHDRSQDELLLATQEAQQRDPQASSKHDKSEQTDIQPDEYELDDCLLESNDIVITQNKDGFVLHVKKVGGNITTAKLDTNDEDQVAAAAVAAATGAGVTTSGHSNQQTTILQPMTSSHQTIKLPSNECELITIKKMIPASTTIATHHQHHHQQHQQLQPHQINIIQQTQQQHIDPISFEHHILSETQTELEHEEPEIVHHHHQQQQQHHHHGHHQQHDETVYENIVTATSATTAAATTSGGVSSSLPHTISLLGLRNVQITEQPIKATTSTVTTSTPLLSRIKYSRGKIITTQDPLGVSTSNVQIIESHDSSSQSHDLNNSVGKYEISEIDLNNTTASASIISDLVKYAEIDDIELPDGTKIGIGFAPTEITEQQLQTVVEQQQHHQQHQHHHHLQQQQLDEKPIIIQDVSTMSHLYKHEHEQEHDEATTSVEDEEVILPDGGMAVHEQPLTKSYTILTTRQQDLSGGDVKPTVKYDPCENSNNTTTYELSLSDSSMHPDDTKYECRHCGKKYRWKSTLRRHENVECGGKEPCHPCPHCSYKAKQRGNLGVHVRKHHPDKPQLESKRGRK